MTVRTDRAILYVATGDKSTPTQDFMLSIVLAAIDFLEVQVKFVITNELLELS